MSVKNRGFASMSPARRSEVASMGGQAAHARGTAHQWTHAEAKAAGSKGGQTKQRRLMAELMRSLEAEAEAQEALEAAETTVDETEVEL